MVTEQNSTPLPRPLALESYVSFGLVCRVPLHLANDILQHLTDNGDLVKFIYHRIGNNKLRLVEGAPEEH